MRTSYLKKTEFSKLEKLSCDFLYAYLYAYIQVHSSIRDVEGRGELHFGRFCIQSWHPKKARWRRLPIILSTYLLTNWVVSCQIDNLKA